VIVGLTTVAGMWFFYSAGRVAAIGRYEAV
jgi:hypothetical protein